MFYAASNCCLEILIELLEKGHANVKQVANDEEKTALSKAHNYEAVMILTMYGAETSKKDMKRLMEWHTSSSPKAILSQSISEVNNDLLVLDLEHFQHTTEENNEMDLHLMAQDHGRSELLIHPILQVFLDLKWNQVKKYYWFNLFVDMMFVIFLTFTAYHFLDLIYCQPCDELVKSSWSMKTLNGTINCFSPHAHCYGNKLSENCEGTASHICSNVTHYCQDSEKCANFTKDGETTSSLYDTWKNLNLKCHKNFLR